METMRPSSTRRLAERLATERPVVVMGRGHSGTRVLAWALEALGVRMGTRTAKPTGDLQDRRFTRRIKRIAKRYVPRPALGAPRERDVDRFRRAAARYLEWLDSPEGRDGRYPPRETNVAGVAGGTGSGARGRTRGGARGRTGDPSGVQPEAAPPRWGFKFPETYLIGNVVDRAFPRALHVHMVRDGRDLAFKEHLTDDADRGLGRAILEHLGLLDRPHAMQAAISWDWQVRRFEEVESVLGDRVLRMTFEELCLDPEATMERLCAFLGMPMNEACRDYLATNIRRGKVSQHRSEDPEVIRAIEAEIGSTLRRFGYAVPAEPAKA